MTTHAYVTPGMVDIDVMRRQAIDRRDKEGKTTWIHNHRYLGPCDETCTMYSPNTIKESDDNSGDAEVQS